MRLASRLTGYELEVIRESELQEKEEESIDIMLVEGLTEKIRQKLISNGYETAEDILDAGIKKIMDIPGVGSKTAEKIILVMNSYYEEEN